MTKEQLRAEEIFLGSATFETDFKPFSLTQLLDALQKENIQSSTSALGRWKQKFDWDKKLETIITASTVKDERVKDIIDASSMGESVHRILEDFEANELLKSQSLVILQKQMKYYGDLMEDGRPLSLDNTKMVLQIYTVTSGREDKLLDRQALVAASRLTKSEDVLKALMQTPIDVEIED